MKTKSQEKLARLQEEAAAWVAYWVRRGEAHEAKCWTVRAVRLSRVEAELAKKMEAYS